MCPSLVTMFYLWMVTSSRRAWRGKLYGFFFPAGDVFCLVERLGGLSIAAAELKQLIGLVKPPEDEEKVRNGQVSLE